jgi:hypothetical protein
MIERPFGGQAENFSTGWCSVSGANCTTQIGSVATGEPAPRHLRNHPATPQPACVLLQHHK